MSKYFTKDNRPERSVPERDLSSMTEESGYIPPKMQIESMIQAGMRLEEARANQYDFQDSDEVPDGFIVKVRDPGYDIADAHQDMMNVEAVLTAQEKEAADLAAQKTSTTVEESSTDNTSVE